jgi:hypothetical protein
VSLIATDVTLFEWCDVLSRLSCLQVKYSTLHWRPVTAFRTGYSGFESVPTWEPLL